MPDSYLQVENLSKTFAYEPLFTGLTFGIDEGDKVGLIAKNGMGKSTLLNILAGDVAQDEGTVTFRNGIRLGYLRQTPRFESSHTVIDTCLEGNDRQSLAVKHYEHALRNGSPDAMTAAIQEMDSARAWDYGERFKQVLSQLKITDLSTPVSSLSGGQIKRVALAKILISEPQMLILDEPTNHLDIDIIEWLEGYLCRSRTTLLMVTHDRYFLDNICSKIIELDQKSVYTYNGNYDYYLEKRAERIDAQNAATARARNLLRTELEWMRRQPQARAHKAKYRIDAFYDLRDRAMQHRRENSVQLTVQSAYIGKKIFTAHHVSKSFGDKVILQDFSYTFARYEKVGIVGDNGVGKTTFIRLLLGQLQPDSGHFEIGETVKFGYYSQEGMHFDEGKQVIDAVTDVAESIWFSEKVHYTASQFLQLFLFSPTDQRKLISNLSGGEKRRLYLAMVLLSKPNFLILDEPTNDLDIATLEILEDYLRQFNGCVIIVSHDRFFMDRTVSHTFVFQGNGVIKDFPGNYSDYRAWSDIHKPQAAQKSQPKGDGWHKTERTKHDNSNRLTYKEAKELEQLNQDLERLNREKEDLEAIFNSGQVIDDAAQKAARYESLCAELDAKESRWLELSDKQ